MSHTAYTLSQRSAGKSLSNPPITTHHAHAADDKFVSSYLLTDWTMLLALIAGIDRVLS